MLLGRNQFKRLLSTQNLRDQFSGYAWSENMEYLLEHISSLLRLLKLVSQQGAPN